MATDTRVEAMTGTMARFTALVGKRLPDDVLTQLRRLRKVEDGPLPRIVYDAMFDVFVRLNEELGMTILLVEQNAILALGMSDRAYVLSTGRILLEGAGEELLEDPRVQASYLGIK